MEPGLPTPRKPPLPKCPLHPSPQGSAAGGATHVCSSSASSRTAVSVRVALLQCPCPYPRARCAPAHTAGDAQRSQRAEGTATGGAVGCSPLVCSCCQYMHNCSEHLAACSTHLPISPCWKLCCSPCLPFLAPKSGMSHVFLALGNVSQPPLLPLQGWKGQLESRGAQGAEAAVLHHAGYSMAGEEGCKTCSFTGI